jgi:hypothetical protein
MKSPFRLTRIADLGMASTLCRHRVQPSCLAWRSDSDYHSVVGITATFHVVRESAVLYGGFDP